MRRVARVEISFRALEEVLGLDDRITIIAVVPPNADDIAHRRFTILIEGGRLGEVGESHKDEVPLVVPPLRKKEWPPE